MEFPRHSISPEALIKSADKIDNRLGPVPGTSSDRIAGELRQAAALISAMQAAIAKTRTNLAGLSKDDGDIYAAMVRRLDSATGKRGIFDTEISEP